MMVVKHSRPSINNMSDDIFDIICEERGRRATSLHIEGGKRNFKKTDEVGIAIDHFGRK